MPYLTNGNTKLGKSILNFNIPTSSCMHTTPECRKYCYAKKGAFNYPNVKRSMLNNLLLTPTEAFAGTIIEELKQHRDVKYVRVHSCGDFYNQEYFDKWNLVAKKNPKVRFLAYTRNYDIDFSSKEDNFAIYYSIDDGTKKMNDTLELRSSVIPHERPYAHMEKTDKGYACASKCKVCKACFYGKVDIAFPVH